MHVKSLSIGSVTVNDVEDVQFSGGAQVVGDSSEDDAFANHFLQAVEKSRSITVSTKDLAGAEAVMNTYQGSKSSFSVKIPSASESGGTSCISLSCTTKGCLVVQVDIGAARNSLGTASIQLEFASTGAASKLTVNAV